MLAMAVTTGCMTGFAPTADLPCSVTASCWKKGLYTYRHSFLFFDNGQVDDSSAQRGNTLSGC